MKSILLFAVLLATACHVFAQNHYRFEEATAPYTNLADATVVQNPNFASGSFIFIDLAGETFKFYDVPFAFGGIKTLAMQPNGNARVDNDSSAIIIDGAFGYLDSIDNISELSYKVEGPAGNRIVKMQWKHLKCRAGQDSNYINLQIWLYQQSGVIECRYGSSYKNASGFTTTTGPQVGIFYGDDDFTKIYQKLWVTNTPANIILDSAKTFTFKAMAGIPANGTVYRFVPRFGLLSINMPTQNAHIGLYPNPAQNTLYFNKPTTGMVYNTNGRLVLTFKNTTEADINNLPAGIYQIYTAQGAWARFVKQ
jgi:hypothetical protein